MNPRRESGISMGILSIALIAMTIILLLALIKIYLSNRIYYESRQANRLERQVAALKEENTLLHMRVEKLKYKSQIADTIFTMEEDASPSNPSDKDAQ